ncbi:MAG: NAD(P)H-hydrate dehydratase [Planctomycetaceae bacterium]|nr:NAD(P)H-hydrate dehydratase [Planctomycetaceae bacterium]
MPNDQLQRVTDLPDPPARPADGHKGTFGRVLLIGGSPGMSGAISLAGIAALRSGAGLVYLAVSESILPVVAAIEPSYVTIAFENALFPDLVKDKDAIGIGPGLGTSNTAKQLLVESYTGCSQPVVVDADGLNLLAAKPSLISQHTGPRILTPHPGEFSRLINRTTAEIADNREQLAVDFARTHQVTLLLKGHETIVTDGERLAINTTGNSGMATGGSGDVLTGIIAGLAGQGMPPFEASQLGAHLHGLAGDIAATEISNPGLIASDIARCVGVAWQQL